MPCSLRTDTQTEWLLWASFQGFRIFSFKLLSRIGPTYKLNKNMSHSIQAHHQAATDCPLALKDTRTLKTWGHSNGLVNTIFYIILVEFFVAQHNVYAEVFSATELQLSIVCFFSQMSNSHQFLSSARICGLHQWSDFGNSGQEWWESRMLKYCDNASK